MSNPLGSSSVPQGGAALLLLATTLILAAGMASADTRSSGQIVTTSVTKLDLAALSASAFGDTEEAH